MSDIPPNWTGIIVVAMLCATGLGGIALSSWAWRRWLRLDAAIRFAAVERGVTLREKDNG